MAELSRLSFGPRNPDATVRVARLAERQWGVVTWAQLERCGVRGAAIVRAVRSGRLHRLYPGVYAVGHRALSVEGQLFAALAYAGPGAALSHGTAAWWWQLVREAPPVIHIIAAGRRRSITGVAVHHPRHVERTWHRQLPVTPVPRTLLDFASSVPVSNIRRALAEAEYRRLVTLDEVRGALGRGHHGSAKLRRALARHQPQLAYTRSELEVRFLALCARHDIPTPVVNAIVIGLMVDALWPEQRVIVELDGQAAHGTAAAMERDRRRELQLRGVGYGVLRYTWSQIVGEPERVAADLRAALTR